MQLNKLFIGIFLECSLSLLHYLHRNLVFDKLGKKRKKGCQWFSAANPGRVTSPHKDRLPLKHQKVLEDKGCVLYVFLKNKTKQKNPKALKTLSNNIFNIIQKTQSSRKEKTEITWNPTLQGQCLSTSCCIFFNLSTYRHAYICAFLFIFYK